MSNFKHFDNLNTARFVTFCCYRKMNNFRESVIFELFIKHLTHVREKYNFKLFGYVIMPNHVHLVLHPKPETKLGLLIRELKSKMAENIFPNIVRIFQMENMFFGRNDAMIITAVHLK